MIDFNYKRASKFLLTGGVATCIDFIVYMLLIQLLPTYFSKAISMLCAMVWSFLVDRRWVFDSQKRINTKLVAGYLFVQTLNMATNVSTNQITLYITQNIYISFVVATICGALVNYNLQRKFIFNR